MQTISKLFKNKINFLVFLLIACTLCTGMYKTASGFDSGYERRVRTLCTKMNTIIEDSNKLISAGRYGKKKEKWDGLEEEAAELSASLKEYENVEDWAEIYSSLSAAVESVENVTKKGAELSVKGELSSEDQARFKKFQAAVTSANKKISALNKHLPEASEVEIAQFEKPSFPKQSSASKTESKTDKETEETETETEKTNESDETLVIPDDAVETEEPQETDETEDTSTQVVEQPTQSTNTRRSTRTTRSPVQDTSTEYIVTEENVTTETVEDDTDLASGKFVLDKRNNTLHATNCSEVSKINEANKQYIEGTISLKDYNLCQNCIK